jgi:hypothetical protein
MKRFRQEAAEHYEVTGQEIAEALGLYMTPGDTLAIYTYADHFHVVVRSSDTEEVDLEPTRVPVMLPPFDPAAFKAQFGEALSGAG